MQIRKLKITRYRGLSEYEWQPIGGLNCLVGPADSGKSTLLNAISLLLTPTPSPAISEFDYYQRDISAGFEIEAVIAGVPPEILGRIPMVRGWKDGEVLPLPDENGAEPVLVVRVSGTSDLEVSHQVVPSSGEPGPFSTGIRQRLPFARVNASEYYLREFRLGRGSLLDKTIEGSSLRGLVPGLINQAGIDLPADVAKRLEDLKAEFLRAGIAKELSLGVIAPYGYSLTGMIGLLSGDEQATGIPVALAGSGTRQRALFELAALLVEEMPIIVVDEPECGLEPYRQRALIARIRKMISDGGQAFITTHSTATLSAMTNKEVCRLPAGGAGPLSLANDDLERLFKGAPDIFLSPLPVLVEGVTEVGFLSVILGAKASSEERDLDSMGVRLARGHGQPQILDQARALSDAGISFGLFVDDEQEFSGKRKALRENPLCVLGCWDEEQVQNVEEAISRFCTRHQVAQIVDLAARQLERSVGDLLRQIGERLGDPGAKPLEQLWADHGESAVRQALADAMNKKKWFKTRDRAEGLAQLLVTTGIPREVDSVVSRFWSDLKDLLA